MRGCSCRGTAGFAHVSCLAEQAKILFAEGGVNDVDGDGNERTLLLWATFGGTHHHSRRGEFHERNVAPARLLVERGADVNHRDHRGYTPLHYASFARSESSPAMVALLLKAGANVSARNSNSRNNPLTLVLAELAMRGPSRSRIEIVLMLLRALPSLDCAWTETTGHDYSIESVLKSQERPADTPLPPAVVNCFRALRAVVAGVRAAGGWRAYDRRPRAEILRLRSLALRRRAGPDRLLARPRRARAGALGRNPHGGTRRARLAVGG